MGRRENIDGGDVDTDVSPAEIKTWRDDDSVFVDTKEKHTHSR